MFRILLLPISIIIAILFISSTEKAPSPSGPDKLSKITNPLLSKNSLERRAKEMTLRVRNTTCSGSIKTGSALLQGKVVLSNRHVLEDAASVELNTWDGRRLVVAREDVRLSQSIDLASINLREPLSEKENASIGRARLNQKIYAVGYPGGDKVRLTKGKVLSIIPGSRLLQKRYSGKIIVTSASVRRGNSGGPLLRDNGDVIAIVFAAGLVDGQNVESYAIPIEEALRLQKKGITPEC